eukprot:TRINITY_DN26702_c0_g1_i1.p1 TRINITY_DN26702_c0_g1~~TRINITY_DN26702_c0_g1_i1.p1  ORF type:complete len:499 (+),score=126.88 TRINITY_DN26702_c0_g1_i1:93-1589(+)
MAGPLRFALSADEEADWSGADAPWVATPLRRLTRAALRATLPPMALRTLRRTLPPRLLLAGLLLLGIALAPAPRRAAKIDDGPELAVEQVKEEALLEAKYAKLKREYGVEDPRTLTVFFELFDLWIMLYRLNKADRALAEVVPACEWRGDDFAIKAIQALAFTRWKQGRFREALSRFHEMEGWMGKNAALCENIGHTYNALGELASAEQYFQDALRLTRQLPAESSGNSGGILLGLANSQERQGNLPASLQSAQEAYDFYKQRDGERGWESSLTAKAAMQVAKVQMLLGDLSSAHAKTAEAVRVFEETAGDDSPLVASALDRLGQILWAQGRSSEARAAYHRAYRLEGIKDAFDLVTIIEIHNRLVQTHLQDKAGLDRSAFRSYFDVVSAVVARVRVDLPQDGNAGAYYKVAGELFVLGGDCEQGKPLLNEAADLFAGEKSVDTSNLIIGCQQLVAFCDGTLSADASASASASADAEGAPRAAKARRRARRRAGHESL